jgi:cobalt-precorrin 5A hydrolase/precorrin-3B C17-methyltransferase
MSTANESASIGDLDGPQRGLSPDAIYPILLTQLRNVPVIVVGGGPVGERKVRGLLTVGAAVHLISPEATPRLQTWGETGQIEWKKRPYQAGDLAGAVMVFAATNQRAVNARVAQEAAELGLLCNVVDAPNEGNFYLPAVHRSPQVVIAVSTAGRSPARARQLRDRLAEWLARQTDLTLAEENDGRR